MRGEGELPALRFHELLDAVGRAVEAPREVRDLVAALDRRAGGQVPAPQVLDAQPQALEPPGQPAHERPRPDPDREGQETDRRHQAHEVARVRAQPRHDQQAAVPQAHREENPPAKPRPVPGQPPGRRERQGGPHPGKGLAGRRVDRRVDAEARGEPLEGGLQLRGGALGPREHLARRLRDALGQPLLLPHPEAVPPRRSQQDGEQGERGDDGGVDLRREASHQPLVLRLREARSRRRARSGGAAAASGRPRSPPGCARRARRSSGRRPRPRRGPRGSSGSRGRARARPTRPGPRAGRTGSR